MNGLVEVRSKSDNYELHNGQRVNFAVANGEELRMVALGCPKDIAKRVAEKRRAKRAAQTAPRPAAKPAPVYRSSYDPKIGDEARRKLAAAIGQKIKLEEAQERNDADLKRRMRALAGISDGKGKE